MDKVNNLIECVETKYPNLKFSKTYIEEDDTYIIGINDEKLYYSKEFRELIGELLFPDNSERVNAYFTYDCNIEFEEETDQNSEKKYLRAFQSKLDNFVNHLLYKEIHTIASKITFVSKTDENKANDFIEKVCKFNNTKYKEFKNVHKKCLNNDRNLEKEYAEAA